MKTINKISLVFVMALGLGCAQEADKENTYLSEKPADEQMIPISMQDSLEKVFTETLNEIDLNLEMIREKEVGIKLGTKSPEEEGVSKKEKILRNINILNSLLAESSAKIDNLNKQLKNFRNQNTKLEKLTARLSDQIAEHEKSIASLKEDLVEKNFELADLNKRLSDVRFEAGWNKSVAEKLNQEADLHQKDINTAYYTKGSRAELKEDGIISRTGGIAGIGKTGVVKGDIKPEQFTKIDIREIKKIPINAKKAKLVSIHDPATYNFQVEGDIVAALEIRNPEEFWKQSKFMVLEVKE